MRHFSLALSRTVAIYTFAAWAYVALVAVFLPQTLSLRLTHLLAVPRTDTFGEACFIVSLISYFTYRLLVEFDRRSAA